MKMILKSKEEDIKFVINGFPSTEELITMNSLLELDDLEIEIKGVAQVCVDPKEQYNFYEYDLWESVDFRFDGSNYFIRRHDWDDYFQTCSERIFDLYFEIIA